MGTFYTYGASRSDIIKECTKQEVFESREHKGVTVNRTTLRHCTVGNCLWQVIQFHVFNKAGIESIYQFIQLDLLTRSKEGWGYKPMSEDMGPYYYSCPMAYFELAPMMPILSQGSLEWREKVREHNRMKVEVKDKVNTMKPLEEFISLASNSIFEFLYKYGRNYVVAKEKASGKVYKVKYEHIKMA